MARWRERPVNVCASRRTDRWVNVSECMSRSRKGSGVDGKRIIKRNHKMKIGEEALKVLRWLKGLKMYLFDKS